MGAANKLLGGNPKDIYRLGLLKSMLKDDFNNLSVFHFGEVVKADTTKFRLKVRIPLLDDVYYIDSNNGNMKQGVEAIAENDNLPWCIMPKRFVDFPEVGSVVLVALFDPQNPYKGRMFLTELGDDEVSKEVYTAYLTPMQKLREEGWDNAENLVGVRYNNSPIRDKKKFPRHGQTKPNYKVGILGKGDNNVILDENNVKITQGVNDPSNQSSITVEGKKVSVNSSGEIELLSSEGGAEYNPVFDDPLFEMLTNFYNTMKALHTILKAVPYSVVTPQGPGTVAPLPQLQGFSGQLQILKSQLDSFKRNGSSKKVKIN